MRRRQDDRCGSNGIGDTLPNGASRNVCRPQVLFACHLRTSSLIYDLFLTWRCVVVIDLNQREWFPTQTNLSAVLKVLPHGALAMVFNLCGIGEASL